MNVTTSLNSEQYKKFKEKAAELGISEYALAKEGIIELLNESPEQVQAKRLVQVFKEFFESGREIP